MASANFSPVYPPSVKTFFSRLAKAGNHPNGAVAVGHIGRRESDNMRQSQSIDPYMPLDSRFFTRVVPLCFGGVGILGGFRVDNQHGRLRLAVIRFPLYLNKVAQNPVKQAETVFVRLGPNIIMIAHILPFGKIMGNPSPCTALFDEI